MRKYKTPNGTIVTEADLINRYGEQKFQSFLADGKLQEIFEEQSSNTYITPNNTEVTEQDVINRYGQDNFNKFLSEGKLKKKEGTELSSANALLGSQSTEEDYFTGAFGDFLRGVDSYIPIGLGDFVDDMARSVSSGYRQGIAAENASDLLLRGSSASLEDIQSFIDSQKDAQKYGPSDEYLSFQKTYEENGKGFIGFVLGLAQNLSVIPEVMFSSLTSLATNTDALLAAGSVIGSSAGLGAGAGAAVGSILPLAGTAAGAGVGAIAGAATSLPLAFAAAGSVMEMGSTFAELLTEEANGEELTADKVKELLNNPEVYTRIRNKAVARGLAIGAIDAFTGKLGGTIGSKVLTKGGQIAAEAATKGRKIASIAAAGGVEAVGGSVGETAGRLVAGQDLDVAEIALEGIAEAPGSIKDMIAAKYAKPTYKVNGQKVASNDIDNLIETMTLEQLQSTKFKIENDYDGRAGKLQNRLEELSTKKQIQEANPEINEPTLNEMANLQLELNKLEGNKTEVAKTKASELKEKIKALQETPLADEIVNTAIENAIDEIDLEEEFAQLTDEEKAPLLEKANGDEKKAIDLFGEELKQLESKVPAIETPSTEVSNPLSDAKNIVDALNQLDNTEQNKIFNLTPSEFFGKDNKYGMDAVYEAYNQSKQNGTNPELVSAVEEKVSSKTQETPQQTELTIEQAQEIGDKYLPTPTQASTTEDISESNPLKKVGDTITLSNGQVGTISSVSEMESKKGFLSKKKKSATYTVNNIKHTPTSIKNSYEYGKSENKYGDLIKEYENILGANGRFRLGGETETTSKESEVKTIEKKMNKMPKEEKAFVEPSPSNAESKASAISESNSTTKSSKLKNVLKFLGLKKESQLYRRIEDFNGIPMMLGMSDILAAGEIKDSTGKPMTVDGGILFNSLGSNMELAWAGVNQQGATKQHENAVAMYNANKELFDRLWAEGKIPNGQVPMAIMRMGNTAINSNEAVFRYILPHVKSLPLENRKAALEMLKTVLERKADGNSATSWLNDFSDKMDSGELNTTESVLTYLNDLKTNSKTEAQKTSIDKQITTVQKKINSTTKKNKNASQDEIDAIVLEVTKKGIIEKVKKIKSYILDKYIIENNITTLDGFLEAVIKESKNRAEKGELNIFSLPMRSFIYGLMISSEKSDSNGLAVAKTLYGGDAKNVSKILTSKHIYNALGEPSMMNTSQGDVMAVVGINVLEGGGAVKASHNNYGYGPKGGLIALISNPMSGMDVFPEFRAKASRIFTPNSNGVYPNQEAVTSQVGGSFFIDAAFVGTKPSVGQMTDLQVLIGKLRFAFPTVSVFTTQKEFDDATFEKTKKSKEGVVIYGFTKDGKIFLNPSYESLKTPIHEFGHIWIDFLRSSQSGEKGAALLNRGLELVEGTKELKDAISKYGNTPLAREEALVELMATKGKTIIDAAQRSEFQSWMNAVFKYIKEKFTTFKDLKATAIKDLTLEEFINIGLADLFGGKAVSTSFSPAQAESAKTPRYELGDNIVKFIKDARAQGISEAAIKTALRRSGVSNEDIISGIEKSKAQASVRTELSEEFIDGYDRMMNEVDGIIKKSEARGRTDVEILNNIKEYIMGSKVYENATDVQREKLVRDAEKMMGVRQKSAPSANRLIGIIKDIKNITMSEKELLYKRLKDFEEGAKTAKQAWVNASKQLTEEVSELQKKGKISVSQMASVLSKFSKVNMFNPASVERFVDYMSKVFNDADYANKIANANAKRKNALANVNTKIGISETLAPKLQKLFSINPSMIPMSVLDNYISLLNVFSPKKAVLSLPPSSDVSRLADDVLNTIKDEEAVAMELKDKFDSTSNKVYNDDGTLNYSETLSLMLEKEEISKDDVAIMKKYKSQILSKGKQELTDAEKKAKAKEEEDKKKELIDVIKKSDVMQISSLPSRDERKLAGRLEKLLRTDALKSLTSRELENVLKVLDNINNGYLPHYAFLLVRKLNANNKATSILDAVKKAKPLPLTAMYSRLKSIVTKKGSIEELVRRNPLFYVDQIFGDFNTKAIFESVLGFAAQEVSKYRSELSQIQNRISKAEQAVINSFGKNHNALVMSKYKQMTYMIQEEFLSNPENAQVRDVKDFLKHTISKIYANRTPYNERDGRMLQEILDKYTDANGNFDNQALYDSFNEAEKKSIKTIQDINMELGDKAVYTASIIRGDSIDRLNNYVHRNVILEGSKNDIMATTAYAENVNKRFNPSTKSKSLIERTNEISILNFDVYSSAQKGAKSVLMDYYLTEPITTARMSLTDAEKSLNNEKSLNPKDIKVLSAISEGFDEAVTNLLQNLYQETTFIDDAFNYIKKQGYRAILTSVPRFIGELSSNIGSALFFDPKGFLTGIKLRGFITSDKPIQAMNNLSSTETNRLFPSDSLSGKFVDTSGLNEVKGTRLSGAKNTVSNTISKLWDKTGQRWLNGIELTADVLISTPDKVVMRLLWFGSFENKFKQITGKSPDLDKIADNDEAYMNEYEDALTQATKTADKRSVMAGATDNPFMGILKGTIKPDQSTAKKAFNAFNNFMTRFLIYEYITARTGVMAMVNRGEMSRRQGAAVVGGVMTRMIVYTLVGQMLAEAMTDALTGDDEEKDKDYLFGSSSEPTKEESKSFDKKLGQAFASSFTSLLFGRDFGNATKGIINVAVEEFNKSQLDFLRDGEYDPYKDAIQYTIMPIEKQGKQTALSDFLMKFGAAYGPALKTADLIVRKTLEPTKKEEDAIKRQEDERFVRIPLEILGNLGFIPMYKDIRKVVLANIYKDLENADRKASDKKKAMLEMLQGYETESDMKRYDRELWDRTFGPNSAGYDERQAKKELEKEKRRIKQKLKDEMYNYTPPMKRKKNSRTDNTFGSEF